MIIMINKEPEEGRFFGGSGGYRAPEPALGRTAGFRGSGAGRPKP